MDPITLAAIPAAVAFFGGAAYAGHRWRKKRESLWRAIAEERGGAFHPSRLGFWRTEHAAIEVPVAHARVFLDLEVVRTGQHSTTYTRARARFALRGVPRFVVRPAGVIATVGKLVGFEDLELGGDPLYDEEYTVKCTHPDAVREIWTPAAKRTHLERIPGARVTSDGSVVTAIVLGALRQREKIEAALELVGELASYGNRELERYASHEGARFVPAGGRWELPSRARLTIEAEKGHVDVATRATAGGLHLLLACRLHRADLAPFEAELPELDALPRGAVGEDDRPRLREVGPCRLEADADRVLLTWRALPDERVFRAGVALLLGVAAGTARRGAFR